MLKLVRLLLVISLFSFAGLVFADDSDNFLRDVNLEPLERSYVPEDLVSFEDFGLKNTAGNNRDEKLLKKEVVEHLKPLIDLCEEETEMTIFIRSGYRSYALQSTTYSKYGSDLSAAPGHSEHQLGLAFDLETKSYKAKQFMDAKNPVYLCFQKYAFEKGFVQSFTRGNPYGFQTEPWHWRYVGERAGAYLIQNNWQLTPWKLYEKESVDFLTKSFADVQKEAYLKKKLQEVADAQELKKLQEKHEELSRFALRLQSERLAQMQNSAKQEKRRISESLMANLLQ